MSDGKIDTSFGEGIDAAQWVADGVARYTEQHPLPKSAAFSMCSIILNAPKDHVEHGRTTTTIRIKDGECKVTKDKTTEVDYFMCFDFRLFEDYAGLMSNGIPPEQLGQLAREEKLLLIGDYPSDFMREWIWGLHKAVHAVALEEHGWRD